MDDTEIVLVAQLVHDAGEGCAARLRHSVVEHHHIIIPSANLTVRLNGQNVWLVSKVMRGRQKLAVNDNRCSAWRPLTGNGTFQPQA